MFQNQFPCFARVIDNVGIRAKNQARLKSLLHREQTAMGKEFSRGKRIKEIFVFTASERLIQAVAQLQRGRARNEELHIREIVDDAFKSQPDAPAHAAPRQSPQCDLRQ
jgi:hypothetical protein